MRLSLFQKLLAAFLLLSLPPLIWLSADAASRIGEVGSNAVEQATRILDEKASQALALQAVNVAGELTHFLNLRTDDLVFLCSAPKDSQIFKAFANSKKSKIWRREPDPNQGAAEVVFTKPIYSEIAWIAPDGKEIFKVEGNNIAPPARLKNVSDPKNTTYGVEDYFLKAKKSPDVYVGRLVGRHVGIAAQLNGAASVEEAVGGEEYVGHIRWAKGVWDGDKFLGVVTLALDHAHLMEITQHILPLSAQRVVFPSYRSGNYAFLFDDEGWIITHPKYWDIRGLDENGLWVPPYTVNSSKADIDSGRIPFNLDYAGFIDKNYPLAASEVRLGKSGVTQTSNVAGTDKVMAYAPVRFDKGVYEKAGIFGGITIGSKTEGFHLEAYKAGEGIKKASQETLRMGFIVTWLLGFLVAMAAFLLSRNIALPIGNLALMARKISGGNLSTRVEEIPGDEVGDLAQDFNRMAQLLEEKERKLIGSLGELQLSRDDAKAYAVRLEEQLTLIRSIQGMSEFLGTTFDREAVLDILLNNCVTELGFGRASLYLADFGSGRADLIASKGFDTPPHPSENLEGGGIIARVITGRSALSGEITSAGGGQCFGCVPMLIRDRVVGVLYADTLGGKGIPKEDVTGVLQIVGGQAARAIERARLFEEVSRERQFVEAVISSVDTGLITLDSQGNILSLNPYAKKALKLGDDVRGRVFSRLGISPALSSWAATLTQGSAMLPAEFELGIPPSTFVFIPSIFSTDESRGLILQFRDVTQERALAREIERVDRLASLGRLAAGVAHEVRNPLTGVSLLLDDLHDRVPTVDDRKLLAQALREIERLEGLVQNMLDYGRVGPMVKRKVELGQVLEDSLFLIKREARNLKIAIETQIAPDLPSITADPDKLKQALLNFYLNSLKAMEGGGTLTVKAFSSGENAVIEIHDTGTGIPEHELKHIFEPFYSLSPRGTGLGLSIAHSIIADHGGRIEVSSQAGSGTVFTVKFPNPSTSL